MAFSRRVSIRRLSFGIRRPYNKDGSITPSPRLGVPPMHGPSDRHHHAHSASPKNQPRPAASVPPGGAKPHPPSSVPIYSSGTWLLRVCWLVLGSAIVGVSLLAFVTLILKDPGPHSSQPAEQTAARSEEDAPPQESAP